MARWFGVHGPRWDHHNHTNNHDLCGQVVAQWIVQALHNQDLVIPNGVEEDGQHSCLAKRCRLPYFGDVALGLFRLVNVENISNNNHKVMDFLNTEKHALMDVAAHIANQVEHPLSSVVCQKHHKMFRLVYYHHGPRPMWKGRGERLGGRLKVNLKKGIENTINYFRLPDEEKVQSS